MKKAQQPRMYYIGTVMMMFSLVISGIIFVPLAMTYVLPPKALSTDTLFPISIPKINAQAPVIQNVDPWTEIEYKAALERGVAHARGTSLPGGTGTIFLFAHSSGMPWEITRYNTIFLRLGELERGDTISLKHNGRLHRYQVTEKKVVAPQNIKPLLETHKKQLILQTCTPIGTSINRLLVYAMPI